MQQTTSGGSLIDKTTARALRGDRASWARMLAAAFLPVAVAFALDALIWTSHIRWSLFYLGIFLSSWIGGFRSGLIATLLSAGILWWYFTPPMHQIIKDDPRDYLAAMLFVLMGAVISVLHRRLRLRSREVAVALLDSRALADRLQHAVDERRVFAALLENSSDFICIADPDGRPIYVNPAGRALVALPATLALETIDRGEFYPLGLRPVPDVIAKELFETGHWRGETRLRNWRTGGAITVSDTQFLIRDPQSGRLLGIGMIARDMSDAMRHQNELKAANRRLSDALRDLEQSERYLQAILDHSPNGIIIKSLEGRYLVINKGLAAMAGIDVATSLGKTDYELFPRKTAERFRANDHKVLETRAPLITEEKPNGDDRVMLVSKFPLLNEQNVVFAICAIWSDITERKRAEEALRQSAGDLRVAQRVARVGSWHWDLRTETNVWSEELYDIFGQDPTKPPPRLLRPEAPVFTPESAGRLRVVVERLLATGKPYEIELEVVRPDGGRRWVNAHGEPVRNEAGKITGMDGTCADITHVKALQRMREEWTSVIAHDLRQPIGVIAMASDFLPSLHGGEMTPDERAFMKRIRSATNTLARMVDDLLDMSLLEASRLKLERKWVDPAELVTESVDRMMHQAGTAHVRVSAPRQLPQVFVDPMRIGQVLGNLLSNAVKYGDQQHDILVRLDRHNGELEVSVINHGKGIDPDELPHLFDRFARAKATRGSGVPGLGLGLYISKGVVEAHGGRLWAESIPGQTTSFHLALPLTAANREAA